MLANATLLAPLGLTASRAVTLTGANVIDTGGSPLALSGSISGAGAVAFAGGGTVTLSGANSFGGGTSVASGGTVQIASDAALGTGALKLGDATTAGTLRALGSFSSARPILVGAVGGTIDANGNALRLIGPLTANGDLALIGGTIGNSGTISANAGVVVAGDALFSNNGLLTGPSLSVAGSLRGTGLIAAPTTVTGMLEPGNSPGTMTFAAPLTLTPGAVSAFDIDGAGTGTGAGNYSRVVVVGAGNGFAVAGALVPRLRGIAGSATNSFVPPLGSRFGIIAAAGGVSGGFSGLAQPEGFGAGTRFDALYAPTSVTLVVTPAAFAALRAAGLPESPNEAAVGRMLDTARPAAGVPMTGAAASLFGPLYAQPAPAIAPALNELSPTIYGDATMTARDVWYGITGSVDDALAARRDGGDRAGAAPGPLITTIWTNGIGQTGRVASAARPGFGFSATGAVVGIDMPVAASSLAGIALGGESAATSGDGGAANSNVFDAAAYGAWHVGRLFVTGQAAYLHADRDTRRNIGFAGLSATGHGTLDGGGAQVQAGMRLPAGRWWIEPTLTLSALSLRAGSTSEHGTGALDEQISPASLGSGQSMLAMRVTRDVAIMSAQTVRLSATLGWRHEFLDVATTTRAALPALGAPGFTVSPASMGRDSAEVGAGFDLRAFGIAGLYGAYRIGVADRSAAQTASIGLRVVW